jgi:P pilus assembly chaperone PapD
MIKKATNIIFHLLLVKGFALSISPIDLEIEAAKGQGYYTITNDNNSQKVIAITTKSRFLDEDGKHYYEPTKDLIVYPKQLVLKPREKRLVRVIWKAKEQIKEEKSYRIIFAEQNVDVDFGEKDLEKSEKRAGVSFGIRFDGSVYVQPNKKVAPSIEVTEYGKKKIEGEDFFVITLENKGGKRKYINVEDLEIELLMQLKGEKDRWHLLSEELIKKHMGMNLMMLAGGKRRIKIPVSEKEIPENIVGVRISE